MLMREKAISLFVVFLAIVFLAGSAFAMQGGRGSPNHRGNRQGTRSAMRNRSVGGHSQRSAVTNHNRKSPGKSFRRSSGHVNNFRNSRSHNKNARLIQKNQRRRLYLC